MHPRALSSEFIRIHFFEIEPKKEIELCYVKIFLQDFFRFFWIEQKKYFKYSQCYFPLEMNLGFGEIFLKVFSKVHNIVQVNNFCQKILNEWLDFVQWVEIVPDNDSIILDNYNTLSLKIRLQIKTENFINTIVDPPSRYVIKKLFISRFTKISLKSKVSPSFHFSNTISSRMKSFVPLHKIHTMLKM